MSRGLRWGLIGASTIASEHMIGAIRANGGEDPASLSFAGDARLIVRESCGAKFQGRGMS